MSLRWNDDQNTITPSQSHKHAGRPSGRPRYLTGKQQDIAKRSMETNNRDVRQINHETQK